MRTSPPSDLTASRSVVEPGTRSMSPKEAKITPGRRAMAWARSICSSGVTQTGQPGPWTSVIVSGSRRSMPERSRVWVWPPQISISVQGRCAARAIAARAPRAACWSRYSSTKRTASAPAAARRRRGVEPLEVAHGGEDLVHPARLGLVDLGDGEADVDDDELAGEDVRRVGEADLLDHAAE